MAEVANSESGPLAWRSDECTLVVAGTDGLYDSVLATAIYLAVQDTEGENSRLWATKSLQLRGRILAPDFVHPRFCSIPHGTVNVHVEGVVGGVPRLTAVESRRSSSQSLDALPRAVKHQE